MFRSPITENGKLRYGELLKYTLFLALLISFVSARMNNDNDLLINMSTLMIIITQIVFMIQVSLIIATSLRNVRLLIESMKFKGIRITPYQFKYHIHILKLHFHKFVPNQSFQSKHCVIRC